MYSYRLVLIPKVSHFATVQCCNIGGTLLIVSFYDYNNYYVLQLSPRVDKMRLNIWRD